MALKDDTFRFAKHAYPCRFSTRILFGDMDAFRHVNNGATGRYLEEGRADLNIRIFGASRLVDPPDGWQLLFANVTVDYLQEARYPGTVEVVSAVSHVGASSFGIAQAVFQEDRCFALAQSTVVNARHGRSQTISPAEREMLDTLRIMDRAPVL